MVIGYSKGALLENWDSYGYNMQYQKTKVVYLR